MSYGDGYLVRSAASTYPDGMRLDRHDHPWGQLAFCNSGVMRVVSDAAAWLAPPTRAIWLPAGHVCRQHDIATIYLAHAPRRASGRVVVLAGARRRSSHGEREAEAGSNDDAGE